MQIDSNIKVTIKNVNKDNVFLHYTSIDNLDSILTTGLEPRIGKNSIAIEKSKKIFFTVGFDNTLVLMDAWIKWLVLRPKNNFIYRCGAFFMTKSYFPKVIIDFIFKNWINDKKRIEKACVQLNKILNNSVFLILNLEEGIDFDYRDIDEVKEQKFSRKQLNYIYTYGKDSNDYTIEKWNMHTFSNKKISKEKIKVLEFNNSINANDLISYMVDNVSNSNLINELPFFNVYVDRYLLKK